MENFNIDNLNLPMPVSEAELGEFESFVDDFARRMDKILHGDLDDPELDKDLDLPSILKHPPADPGSADPKQEHMPATARAAESQNKNGQIQACQMVEERPKHKVAQPRRGIDYSRFERIVSDEDEDDGTSASSQAPTANPKSAGDETTGAPANLTSESAAQLLDKAKAAGSRSNWPQARDIYAQVVNRLDSRSNDALRAHANLTLAYLKLDQPDLVVAHAEIVLSRDPLHIKAHWRKCAALLTLRDQNAWIRARAELRKAVVERPGELDLVRVIKDESSGWRTMGLVEDFAMPAGMSNVEAMGRALHALGKQGVAPILMWLIDQGLPGILQLHHGSSQICLLSLHCVLIDLLRLVDDDPVTGPILGKLAPTLLAQWIQLLWTNFGSDPAISAFITSNAFPSFDFTVKHLNSSDWYLAAATHIRKSQPHSIPSIVQSIHKSSLHVQPLDHTPWSLIDALVACPAVARDHINTIAINLLTFRPTSDPPISGVNCINVSRFTRFIKQHGTIRLWSRLTRVPSLASTVSQLITNVAPDAALASNDALRAWTVAALDAESVDPTPVLAAAFANKVDTGDNVTVGNAALLIARAVQKSQLPEKDMEVAAKVLLPILQERAAVTARSNQETKVKENLAVALARLCNVSRTFNVFTSIAKAREWVRQKRGMELLANVTATTGLL